MNHRNLEILIVDDHPIVLNGLKDLLSVKDDIEVIRTAESKDEAIDCIGKNNPDLILLDLNLGEESGIEVAAYVMNNKPDIKIIAFTMHDDPSMIREIINNGAEGYLLKTAPPEEIYQAINTVMDDGLHFKGQIAEIIKNHTKNISKREKASISPREKEILKYIVQEFTMQEIASKLFISMHTVVSHRKNMIRKLGVKNTAGLVVKAIELEI